MTLVTMRMWKPFSKKLKIIKVRKKNKKKKLNLNQQERELEVKAPLNKALKPLIVNLLGLDICLIAWTWWNPTSTLTWIPLNQISICTSIKWMKTLLICNMMFITFMSNKASLAPTLPSCHLLLHPLLPPNCYVFIFFILSLFSVYVWFQFGIWASSC